MNTKLRIKANNEFEKYFFKLMINSVFGKTQENIRKQRYIKFVTIDEKRNRLVSEPNYHTTKRFSENLLATEMKNAKAKMNKPVYLGMSILDISKTLMYKFWYDYIKPKYENRAKLCYMDTDSFITHIITELMLKDGLIHLTMMKMIKDLFQQVKTKKYQAFLKKNQEEILLQKLLRLGQKHGRI